MAKTPHGTQRRACGPYAGTGETAPGDVRALSLNARTRQSGGTTRPGGTEDECGLRGDGGLNHFFLLG